MAENRAIALAGVSVDRGGRRVLFDIDCVLTQRRIGVIGANGSGKSSFARLLNALLLPTTGRVVVDGIDTAADARAVRRRVGFLFQNPDNQIVYPTVGEDVAFGLTHLRLTRNEVGRRVVDTLARFGLGGFEDRLVHELSGGERQMVALCGVMILQPAWLVLDEPTTLLDLANTKRVMDAVWALSQNVVLVTHDLDLVGGFDRVLVFNQGRIVADAAPSRAIDAYRRLAT